MRLKRLLAAAALLSGVGIIGAQQIGQASDHDDGETDLKTRAFNLTDHYAFKSPQTPANLVLAMYVNPRSLPQRQYTLSPNARYEFHVSRVANKLVQPTASEDLIFRFVAGEPNAAGVQTITMTPITAGVAGTPVTGNSTAFGATPVAVDAGAGSKFFVGQRSDGFTFDVIRFFQVRSFLAQRFFGGAGGTFNGTSPTLPPNCEGDAFLAGAADVDGDQVNLWNPTSCAPDFTKDYNITAIVFEIPISSLGGGTVFDTWSTISVKQ